MKRFVKSVMHAMHGIWYAGSKEKNFQLEIITALLVIALMFLLPVTASEKVLLSFAIVGVLVLELINTAVELVVDILKPRVHPYARIIKDTMAAAVLISSFGAITAGMIILLPYLTQVIEGLR